MTPTTEEQRAELTRSEFEAAMNERRFFPAELDFTRTKSPSGRDEYVNSHLQSNWEGWKAALSRRSPPPAEEGVDLPPAECDEGMQRDYLPLPGGWEVQTKGNGSTFRIAHVPSDERYLVLDDELHKPLEQMDRDIRAAITKADKS